jgi:uncharacterized protein YjbI with pentapeptide repeats
MELLPQRPDYQTETRQARNAEEALLAALNACARVTERVSKIEWPGKESSEVESGEVDLTSAGAWIARLQGQRAGAANILAMDCLSFLDLSRCRLDMSDFYQANLERTDLQQCALHFANLEQAELHRANLRGAIVLWANLRRANLEGANLEGADLLDANLQGANLLGANLREANLEGANLQGANLQGEEILAGAVGTPHGNPTFVRKPNPRPQRKPDTDPTTS